MDFTGALSLSAGVAANLLTLLVAAGFTRTSLADEVQITAGAAALALGSTAVLAATGQPVAIGATNTERAGKKAIDLKNIWVYCASSTTFYVNVRGK